MTVEPSVIAQRALSLGFLTAIDTAGKGNLADTDYALRIAEEIIRRAAAAERLLSQGINPSPADVEWYLALSERQRRSAEFQWDVMRATRALENPGQSPD